MGRGDLNHATNTCVPVKALVCVFLNKGTQRRNFVWELWCLAATLLCDHCMLKIRVVIQFGSIECSVCLISLSSGIGVQVASMYASAFLMECSFDLPSKIFLEH